MLLSAKPPITAMTMAAAQAMTNDLMTRDSSAHP
jgi:hypothetical protein